MTVAAASMIEAMLRQESRYFNDSHTNENHAHLASMKQAVAALERIHDLCQLKDRETLVMATSYLHRYLLLTPTTTLPYSLFPVALVCFYMAVKIHHTVALPMKSLTDLYQRFFAFADDDAALLCWEHVELHVCQTLQWRLHPPMPLAFLNLQCPSRRLRKRVQACLEAAFTTDPCAFVGRYKASSLVQAALVVVVRGGDSSTTCDDSDGARQFLLDCAASQPPPPTRKTRKRAVTPPASPTSYRPSSNKRPCGGMGIGWTVSPRSALAVADEVEEAF